VDLLSSGPERPPQRASRAWRRRSVRLAAVLLVAAATLLLFRSTVDSPPSGVARSAVDDRGPAVPLPPQPTPPYDRLPGRTPIPEPAQTGDGLSGPLPAIGGPDKRAAGAAVDLVLGRYCLEPRRYIYTLEPDRDTSRADWRHVDVLVFRLTDSGSGPAQRIFLDWAEDGRSYRWLGFLDILDGC
jgi:hypothetical protein